MKWKYQLHDDVNIVIASKLFYDVQKNKTTVNRTWRIVEEARQKLRSTGGFKDDDANE